MIIIIIIIIISLFYFFINSSPFLLKKLIVNNKENLFFPDIGLTEFKIPIYTIFNSDIAKVYFRILNDTSLEYYVFAGSAIGMVRDGKNIPWVDDYDIIIFEDQMDTYINIVEPKLNNHGFTTICSKSKGLYKTIFKYNNIEYLFDVFISYENSLGYIKNINKRGRYHSKNIPMKMVKPAKYLEFDNMGFKIPFFNQLEKDIEKEYGNVFDKVDIHVNHSYGNNIINSHFSKVYKEFYEIVNNAIFNTTKIIINTESSHKYLNQLVIKNKNQFTDRIKLLQYIYKNNIGKIYILLNSFLKFTYSVKYYFPDIQIILYIYKDFEEISPIMLNKVDIVRVPKNSVIEKYTKDIFYVNKPLFEYITIITFGTFDVLHYGHINILRKSKDICNNLIVGVSSDSFNKEKGKKSHDNYEKRQNNLEKLNIADLIFAEESFDKKKYYVDKYKANLLIMGSDWENKFDFLNIPTLYFPRTPNVSSTQIRNLINN